MARRLSYFLLVVGLSISNAHGFCINPNFYETMPEPPPSFSKPSIPYCLSSYAYSGKHTCSDWELDNYFDEVNTYIDDLQRYYSDVVSFANSAAAHADSALRYARCEADDVSTQHE